MAYSAPANTRKRAAPSHQLRQWLARSNHFVIARLPAAWVYWLAMPHEIWHYLAARALGLPARVVPAATIYQPTACWQRALVLLAPATLGLVIPVGYHLAVQAAAGAGVGVNWGMLLLAAIAWWSGCVGDFMDVWLLLPGKESRAQHQARMRHILRRYESRPHAS